MKALLVIDIQRAYIGKNHSRMFKYDEELIPRINRVIEEYEPKNVFYIMNYMKKNPINTIAPVKTYKFTDNARLSEELLAVSSNIFEKYKGDAFSNPELARTLKRREITELELVGIDGGGCVALTALGAVKAGFAVTIRTNEVGTMLVSRAEKLRQRLLDNEVVFSE